MTYAVAVNTGGVRTGTISVSGQPFNIGQSGSSCTHVINPAVASIHDPGGSVQTIVNTAAGCLWTASSNASWITVTSGASGSGPGAVVMNVARTRAARAGDGDNCRPDLHGDGRSNRVRICRCLDEAVRVSEGQFILFSVGSGSSLITQTVSITTNTSASVIQGPVYLVTMGMPTHQFATDPFFANSGLAVAPPGTTLTTCFTAAGDYYTAFAGNLGPGQTVNLGTLTWIQGTPGLGYSTKVLSESPHNKEG